MIRARICANIDILRVVVGSVALIGITLARPATAASCGADECGVHGSCNSSSLLPRCTCDEGYFSVSTFVGGSSLGAYCVPLAAPPSATECAPLHCGPHGVCTIRGAGDAGPAATCTCDLGYRANDAGGCEDDPNDDSELECANVDCGDNAACMVISDAVTCRCLTGGSVVLGGGRDGGFGPVCSTPPDPKEACGPEACGVHGNCVISQAVFCDCDDGYGSENIKGSDGRPHPYCLKPGESPPSFDAGVAPPAAGVLDAGYLGDAGALDYVSPSGCNCRTTRYSARSSHGAALGMLLALGALRRRRRN